MSQHHLQQEDISREEKQGNRPEKREKLLEYTKIILAILLFVFILSQTNSADFILLLNQVDLKWLLLYSIMFILSTALFTYRYWCLIKKSINFHQALNLVIIQNSIGNLVSSAAGIVSFVAILRGRYNIRITQSTSSLVIARFSDLLIILFALPIATWLSFSKIETVFFLILWLFLIILCIVLLFIALIIFRSRFIKLSWYLFSIIKVNHLNVVKKFMSILAEIINDLDVFLKMFKLLSLTSLAILLVSTFSLFATLRLFSLDLFFGYILFVVLVVQIIGMIPIHVFGGLGTIEITSIYLFGLFGLDEQVLIPMVIGSRIIFYIANLLVLLYIPLDMLINQKNRS
ncbi:flippase-like domain-containing protein [Candidatus Chloroploca sp. M-50]|uniref:Flippase-like domain-containing protein n=1 Tax=Candidatus Chloroploca mongolica TaxID=2528176 RepID=A0ABS4DD01_9CHLR|nr:lysylphosphatidylglycerol synthase transmembrane domain-containing protein [Candidatus Chloroploca mongolica]MBP1467308.1 flippase-like domain-containing protein [Candidatus Chloroploca mongolica]